MSSDTPTIDSMNEVIALFDGWKRIKGEHASLYKKDGKVYALGDFKYHTSWDCLKPVIDEIFNYALAHPEEVRPVRELSIVVNIQAAHEKVYQFCKWYNNQNKNR